MNLLENTLLLWTSLGTQIQRVDGLNKFITLGVDASAIFTDGEVTELRKNNLNGSATASQQPRLIGGIAPGSKVAAANLFGDARKFTLDTAITVTGTYTVVKMVDGFGKYIVTYDELTTGTITEVTWTNGLRVYMVYDGILSAGERTAVENILFELHLQVESTTISLQSYSTRNFEATTTPEDTVITNVTDNATWATATTLYNDTVGTEREKLVAAAMWCYYDNDINLGATYGKLYNWYATKLLDLDMISSGFGWRITQDINWDDLKANSLDSNYKHSGETYWQAGNVATNSNGFTVLPAGYRNSDGTFKEINQTAVFWNSDEPSDLEKLLGLSIRIKKIS